MKKIIHKTILYLVLIILALLFVAPILFMIAGSFKPDEKVLIEAGSFRALIPSSFSLENYGDVFRRVNFNQFLFNSFLITTGVVLGGLLINSLAGYSFARLKWKGHKIMFGLILSLMIIPFEAIAVPLFYQIIVLGWRDSYHVQIVPFLANAFSIYLFYTFFLGIPKDLEEAARIDGANPWKIFLFVALPLSKPILATVGILTFLTQWGSFLWPLMVTVGETYRPLPVAISTFKTLPPLEWGDIMAFGVMMVLPVLILFLLFQKWFVRSLAATGSKN